MITDPTVDSLTEAIVAAGSMLLTLDEASELGRRDVDRVFGVDRA